MSYQGITEHLPEQSGFRMASDELLLRTTTLLSQFKKDYIYTVYIFFACQVLSQLIKFDSEALTQMLYPGVLAEVQSDLEPSLSQLMHQV